LKVVEGGTRSEGGWVPRSDDRAGGGQTEKGGDKKKTWEKLEEIPQTKREGALESSCYAQVRRGGKQKKTNGEGETQTKKRKNILGKNDTRGGGSEEGES